MINNDSEVLDFGAGRGAWAEDEILFRMMTRNLKGKVKKVYACDIDKAIYLNKNVDDIIDMNDGKVIFPNETMIGALVHFISNKNQTISNRKKNQFQPMPASFGLVPELSTTIKDKKLRYKAYKERSLNLLYEFKKNLDSYSTKDQLLVEIN